MKYKAYYHRHGSLDYAEYDDLVKAVSSTRYDEEAGECFADCVVDENNVIVHDFQSLNDVFGVKEIPSRVGEKFERFEK